jgi:hypothetical protein
VRKPLCPWLAGGLLPPTPVRRLLRRSSVRSVVRLGFVRFGHVNVAGRVVGDAVCNAAQYPAQAAHPLVAHDDQPGVVLLGLLHQCMGRRVVHREVGHLQLRRAQIDGQIPGDLLGPPE